MPYNNPMKNLILLLVVSFNLFASETLTGIDSNKNKVRDDVETLIKKNITQDPEQYAAYLAYAQSVEAMMYVYPKLTELKTIERQKRSDTECLRLLEKNTNKLSENMGKIISAVQNTVEREAVARWHVQNEKAYEEDYIRKDKYEKNLVCRKI